MPDARTLAFLLRGVVRGGRQNRKVETTRACVRNSRKPLIYIWCPEPGSNRHVQRTRDFKSLASTNFAIGAVAPRQGIYTSLPSEASRLSRKVRQNPACTCLQKCRKIMNLRNVGRFSHANTLRKNGAVRLSSLLATVSGVPLTTILPPLSPAPGPMSITQSLWATTRISCSTTTTV
jgi:hypothetical protein